MIARRPKQPSKVTASLVLDTPIRPPIGLRTNLIFPRAESKPQYRSHDLCRRLRTLQPTHRHRNRRARRKAVYLSRYGYRPGCKPARLPAVCWAGGLVREPTWRISGRGCGSAFHSLVTGCRCFPPNAAFKPCSSPQNCLQRSSGSRPPRKSGRHRQNEWGKASTVVAPRGRGHRCPNPPGGQ